MWATLVSKSIGLFVKIRFYSVPPALRSFYKDTYSCQVRQIRYFFKDYIKKKPYKITAFSGEFAPELQFVLPFVYWHYKNNTLKQTQAARFTKEFYFFSPDHQELFDERSNEGNYNFEMPRVLYSQDYNIKKWLPVPFKDYYKNDFYKFEKPTLIIANRYNMEWNGPPISFFSIAVLDKLIPMLSQRYTLIYNRPQAKNITNDNSAIYDLDEYDWLRTTYPTVLLMEDLYVENKAGATSFNQLQMMVYANSQHFISIHGGTSALASYFGGQNIILSKHGPEHHFGCYQKLYPKLSGAKIVHAKTDEQLMEAVQTNFLN